MKKILLDTNAYTGLLRGDRRILDVLAGAETVYLSIFVLGELHAGFRGGDRRGENETMLREFLGRSTVRIMPADTMTAEIFGEIQHRLAKAGTPLPINDVWIAAHAKQSGSFLVTFDRHFSAVPGLLLRPEPQEP